MRFDVVVFPLPFSFRIKVNEQACVPTAIKLRWSAVEIFGRFVKEHVAGFQVSHLCVASVIFDHDGPWFRVVGACNMIDTRDHVGLCSIGMHPQTRFVSNENQEEEIVERHEALLLPSNTDIGSES